MSHNDEDKVEVPVLVFGMFECHPFGGSMTREEAEKLKDHPINKFPLNCISKTFMVCSKKENKKVEKVESLAEQLDVKGKSIEFPSEIVNEGPSIIEQTNYSEDPGEQKKFSIVY